jgi:hypothetical protein
MWLRMGLIGGFRVNCRLGVRSVDGVTTSGPNTEARTALQRSAQSLCAYGVVSVVGFVFIVRNLCYLTDGMLCTSQWSCSSILPNLALLNI